MKRFFTALLAIILIFTTLVVEAQASISKVKNVILLIGDGMGVAQIYAGYTGNKGSLNLERAKSIGFSKTYSANNYITDSGAGGNSFLYGL
jgi:alkaline phosphatase